MDLDKWVSLEFRYGAQSLLLVKFIITETTCVSYLPVMMRRHFFGFDVILDGEVEKLRQRKISLVGDIAVENDKRSVFFVFDLADLMD